MEFNDTVTIRYFKPDDMVRDRITCHYNRYPILRNKLSYEEQCVQKGFTPLSGKKPPRKKPSKRQSATLLMMVTRQRSRGAERKPPLPNTKRAPTTEKVVQVAETDHSRRLRSSPRSKWGRPPSHTAAEKKREEQKALVKRQLGVLMQSLAARNVQIGTLKQLKEAQARDKYCHAMSNFIKSKKLPEDKPLAREVLLTHDRFWLEEDVLYRVLGQPWFTQVVIVVPKECRIAVMRAVHEAPLSAHQGPRAFLRLMSRSWWWPTINSDCADWSMSCTVCLRSKKSARRVIMPLTLREPQTVPYAEISVDVVGSFSPPSYGNRYIFTVLDTCTKHLALSPMPDQCATTIIWTLYKIVFAVHGVPSVIYSDSGSQFRSKQFRTFCKAFNIKQVFSSPLHKETQGALERRHMIIESYLRCMVSESKDDWAILAYASMSQYNQTVSSTSRFSPNLLLFGREARLHCENGLKLFRFTNIKTEWALFKYYSNLRLKARASAFEKTMESHKAMKARWDKNVYHQKVKPGDMVLLRTPGYREKVSLKLLRKFEGPFLVWSMPSLTSVQLYDTVTGKLYPRRVHVTRVWKPSSSAALQGIIKKMMRAEDIAIPGSERTDPTPTRTKSHSRFLPHAIAKDQDKKATGTPPKMEQGAKAK